MYSHIPKLTKRIHEAFAASSATMKAAHGTRPVHAGAMRDGGMAPHGAAYAGQFGSTHAGPHVMLSPEEQRVVEELDRLVGADTSMRANQVRRWPDWGTPEHQPRKAFEDRYQGRQPKTSFEAVAGSAGFSGDDPEAFARFSPEVRIRELEDEIGLSVFGKSPHEIAIVMHQWRLQLDSDDPEVALLGRAIRGIESDLAYFIEDRGRDAARSFAIEVMDAEDESELSISENPAELSRRSLAWQQSVSIPRDQQSPISEPFAQYLSDQILELIRHGRDEGKTPAAIMETAIRQIHSFAGDEFVRDYTMAALARIGSDQDRQTLTDLANQYLDANHPALRVAPSGHLRIAEDSYDYSPFDEPENIQEHVDNAFVLARESLGLSSQLRHAVSRTARNVARALGDGATADLVETGADLAAGVTVLPHATENLVNGQFQLDLIDAYNSLVPEATRIDVSGEREPRRNIFASPIEAIDLSFGNCSQS